MKLDAVSDLSRALECLRLRCLSYRTREVVTMIRGSKVQPQPMCRFSRLHISDWLCYGLVLDATDCLSEAQVRDQLNFQLSPDGTLDFSVKLTPGLVRCFFDADKNRALHENCLRITSEKQAAYQASGRLPVSSEHYPVTKESCERFFDSSSYHDRRKLAEAASVPTQVPVQRVQGLTAKDFCGFFNIEMPSSVSIGNVGAHKTSDAAARAEALAMQAAPPPVLSVRKAVASGSQEARS